MKVKELIAQLSKLDANLEVYGYVEDERFATPPQMFHILNLDNVDITEGELSRGKDGVVSMTFGAGERSRKFCFLNMSADF